MTAEPPPDAMVGRTLADRYRIDALVARGGMARVYRARDVRLERDVAVKVLAPPYADDPAFTERFLAEARAAASLSHPSLVHVYDSGSDGDAHFIVMELLDRHRSLRRALDDERSIVARRGPPPRPASCWPACASSTTGASSTATSSRATSCSVRGQPS